MQGYECHAYIRNTISASISTLATFQEYYQRITFTLDNTGRNIRLVLTRQQHTHYYISSFNKSYIEAESNYLCNTSRDVDCVATSGCSSRDNHHIQRWICRRYSSACPRSTAGPKRPRYIYVQRKVKWQGYGLDLPVGQIGAFLIRSKKTI